MQPGDILVAFTDGLTETSNLQGQQFSEQGVLRVVREKPAAGAAELSDSIMIAVQRFGGGSPAWKDQTVTVVRFQL
jgi:serine phosphatase RsbU (regulator of sigma subunit)